MPIVSSVKTKPVLVGDRFKRVEIKADLTKLGFRPPFWGLTVYKLQGLRQERYGQLLTLLTDIRNHIDNNLKMKGVVYDLVLPSANALNSLPLDEVLKSEKVRGQIIARCFIDNTFELNLTDLPWIYRTHI